jgi:hypothetical protein
MFTKINPMNEDFLNFDADKVAKTAIMLIILTFLFPPFSRPLRYGAYEEKGYAFILNPPEFTYVNVSLLLTEWLGIILISAIICLMPYIKRLGNTA